MNGQDGTVRFFYLVVRENEMIYQRYQEIDETFRKNRKFRGST
jgi:hypothetical protein